MQYITKTQYMAHYHDFLVSIDSGLPLTTPLLRVCADLHAEGSQKSTLGAFLQEPLTLVFETRSLIRTRAC